MSLDARATEVAIVSGVVGRTLEREVVWVDGPDARSYLQGQMTQDLESVGPGEAVESLLLSPQGKVEAYVRVFTEDGSRFGVDVEDGFGEAVLERLRRFKLRVKATIELGRSPLVEVRGPNAEYPTTSSEGVVALPIHFGSLVGFDLLGERAILPSGVETGDDGAFEVARIVAGVPRMGRELTERTIPAESGIVARTVSFSKGCYTGQELVARLDARGNRVPWNLRLITVDGRAEVESGSALIDGKDEVGAVTSAAFSVLNGRTVALGYLKRDAASLTDVVVRTKDGDVHGAVEELPSAG